MGASIDVVVGDDHPVVREGVVRLLDRSDDIQVVGEADDGQQALDLIRSRCPHVALIDLWMPRLDGAQVADAVRREALTTRVLILSAHTEARFVFEAMQRGAAGYLSKEASRAEIQQGVRDAAAGRDVFPPTLTPGLLGHIRAQAIQGEVSLSGREQQVLAGLAQGTSVPAMAKQMFLAPSTVKTHVQRLYDKLDVNDRGSAVAEAMRRGLLK